MEPRNGGMEKHQTILSTTLILLVLLNTAVTGTVAQQDTRQLPLDGQATELATVHTSGETFVIYEYNNILPYASGIEVYRNGERVTSRGTVDEVFQALARRKATKFQPEQATIQRLNDLIEQSNTIEAKANSSLAPINESIALKRNLRATQMNNTTVWKFATDQATQLDRVLGQSVMGPSDIKTLQQKVIKLRSTAKDLETNSKRVITLLEKRQSGQEINQSDLYRRYDAINADLTDISRQVNDIQETMQKLSTTSETISSKTSSMQPVETNVTDHFAALAITLEQTADSLSTVEQSITETQQSLPRVATNQDYQSELTKRWEERRSAKTGIYITFVEVAMVGIAIGLTILEQRTV